MCGIVGAAGELDFKSEKALKTLLILDSLRGIDSTGVAVVAKGADNSLKIAKSLGNPYELFDTAAFTKAMQGVHKVFIGHNRYATQGKVTRANAHPFEFDYIVGVHNGTLHNKYVLEDGNKFDVDSQALLNHIEKHGAKAAVDKLSGAWAVVWYDVRNNSINFLRNKERPLYKCYSEDGKQIYYASESWMLRIALSRNEIKFTEPELIPENTHYSILMSSSGVFQDEIEEEGVKSNHVVPTGWTNTGNNFQHRPVNQQTTTQQQHPRITPSNSMFNEDGSVKKTTEGEQQKKEKVILFPQLQYAGQKNRRLKGVMQATDPSGADYLICRDEEFPVLCIRVYLKKSDLDAEWTQGGYFYGDINPRLFSRGTFTYFKVEYSSVRVDKKVDTTKEEEDETIAGPNGEIMSVEDWRNKYAFCCCCSGNVWPGSAYRYTSDGKDVACEDCASDGGINAFLKLA